MTISRRLLLGAAATLPLAAPALAAFPEQPVRVVVPWNPGGLADILMRALGPGMGRLLGQPVVIENRAGANGAVGTQVVARSPADGHTLILGNAETHVINPLIYPKLTYNPATEFTPVTTFASGPFVLITRPGLGAETLEAFLAMVRRQPGKITFASWGIGSTSHLAMEALIKQAKLEMLHVPFTGAAPAATALIAGQVDCMFLNAGPAEAAAKDGKSKILGVGSRTRIPQLPNTPTMVELGLPVDAANWFGLLGPAGLPAPVAARIAAVVGDALKADQVQEVFRAQAALPVTQTPAEMQSFLAVDRERWGGVVKDLDIRLE
ncbi:tripartite tricarboxylate transporter substrate binding protein [Siccirubricoccus sp. KC 17139]|uniref:Tripartite tricarboxylate transporter substrate binding protein n=1 Tax=Siccirubricoccus soli TaxID=2899147 RepID=A0ABT1CZH6_9PROT|nr:tripartite tricarboxylate transporter substrate binding protein [Siccirubricoccus soli]MCO6415076.1 tripartite tricarboxylate transporter substrate binding protein [Siccirubricoccus soli]MCP2681207.1 tripartite tricarboxylate transporter substrate binding protein [Siccirubricoccus soli]